YSLMERHEYVPRMQQTMIEEIERGKPAYLVVVNVPTSWVVRKYSNRLVFNWMRGYINNYTLAGVIDIISPTQTIYRWDEEVFAYTPQSNNRVFVFKRKTPA
ncbi:MAG: hypothetical protein NTZ51_10785, partial [Proteobacteria bacterium]|nr:hypothetical protein [Pseudomonadota bacterium]